MAKGSQGPLKVSWQNEREPRVTQFMLWLIPVLRMHSQIGGGLIADIALAIGVIAVSIIPAVAAYALITRWPKLTIKERVLCAVGILMF